jgi:hypothetical protein
MVKKDSVLIMITKRNRVNGFTCNFFENGYVKNRYDAL